MYCPVSITNQSVYIGNSPVIHRHTVHCTHSVHIFGIFFIVKFTVLSRVKIIVKLYSVNIVVLYDFGYTVNYQLTSHFVGRVQKNSAFGFLAKLVVYHIRIGFTQNLRCAVCADSVRVHPCVNIEVKLRTDFAHYLKCVITRIYSLFAAQNVRIREKL